MCQMERLQSNFVCQRGVESLTGIPVAISNKKVTQIWRHFG